MTIEKARTEEHAAALEYNRIADLRGVCCRTALDARLRLKRAANQVENIIRSTK